ncbi:hypothetical protein KCP78_14125 [Salmonella enterica subsp. enterica]|nr:hypothetical protein KCP78_14125 [Salmonella enterica subsp. enterica]
MSSPRNAASIRTTPTQRNLCQTVSTRCGVNYRVAMKTVTLKSVARKAIRRHPCARARSSASLAMTVWYVSCGASTIAENVIAIVTKSTMRYC